MTVWMQYFYSLGVIILMNNKKDNKVETIPEKEGYTAEKRTISITGASFAAIVALAVFGFAGLIAMTMHWGEAFRGMGALLLAFFIGVVVHELIHGLTWVWMTHSSFRHLRFGVMTGAVYCHIDVPMTKRQYVVGALMPLLLLGIVPYVLSFFFGSLWLMTFGTLFISAAMGDVMIVWAIRKETPDTLVYDHPKEAGCLVYRRMTEST